MDQAADSILLQPLTAVPDPRHARGKHVAWSLILGVIACPMVRQQQCAASQYDPPKPRCARMGNAALPR